MGNGSAVVLLVNLCVVWATAGAWKAAIGSRDSGLRTAGDRWIEPVVSSLFDARFSPMLIFRRTKTPHAKVTTHRMLSAIRPPELSHGTAESCRIAKTIACPKTRDQAPEYRVHENPTALRLNRLLEAPSINAMWSGVADPP